MYIHHINCVNIESSFGSAIGHCLLMEANNELTLIDTGIGLAETKDPESKLGKDLITITGFQFSEETTAIEQIKKMGLNPNNVKNCICSHFDPDHIGGIADFPDAIIHVSTEEYASFNAGNSRYLNRQLLHKPQVKLYDKNDTEWFGLPARTVDLNHDFKILLVPLFGHTMGHCGIAIQQKDKWLFYVGDAYYLREELRNKQHPIDQLATIRAENNELRIKSLEAIRELISKYSDQIEYFGYHDPEEMKISSL